MKNLLGEKANKAAWAQTAEKLAPMKEALIAIIKNNSEDTCVHKVSTNSKISTHTKNASYR